MAVDVQGDNFVLHSLVARVFCFWNAKNWSTQSYAYSFRAVSYCINQERVRMFYMISFQVDCAFEPWSHPL